MNLMVLSAISRDSSTTHIAARLAVEIAEGHAADVAMVTPADLALPVNDGTVAWDLPEAEAWRTRVGETQAWIWISPEYHSGMAASLKNLFDHLPKEPMKGDVVGLCALAGGAMAALNTLNNMSVVARSLGAWVAPEQVALNSDEVKEGLGEGSRKRFEAMVVSVIDAARRLESPGETPDDLPID